MVDTYALAPRYAKYLRVTDVADGLDAVGRADLTLLDPAIRPLWMGCKFWGPAVTMRILPANERMPTLSLEEARRAHNIWAEMGGFGDNLNARLNEHFKPGCVIVSSTSETRETGWWGSNNTMDLHSKGAVGIVSDGQCRDTDEVMMQQTPVACRGIGRPIIPGRAILADVQVPIGCGGVLVRPGDLVGCDWDGVVVVPHEVAEEVLAIAAAIAVDDKKSRRALYERMGKEPDETVDWQAAQEYYKDVL
jgi:regulator of RNase E activity RraA